MAHRIILVLVKGGRDSITPLKAIHTWYNKRYILPIWVIICYIPPFTRTWKICWTTATVVQWLIPNIRRDKNMLLYILQFFPESEIRNSSADAFIYICFVSSRIFTTSQASIPLVTVHLKLWCCLMMSARHFWWLVWLNVTWCLSLVGSPRPGWIFGWLGCLDVKTNGRCGHVQIVPMCGKSSCMSSQMQIFKILSSNLDL